MGKASQCACGHNDYDHGERRFNCLVSDCSCIQFGHEIKQAPQKALEQEENYLERIAIALERIADYMAKEKRND